MHMNKFIQTHAGEVGTIIQTPQFIPAAHFNLVQWGRQLMAMERTIFDDSEGIEGNWPEQVLFVTPIAVDKPLTGLSMSEHEQWETLPVKSAQNRAASRSALQGDGSIPVKHRRWYDAQPEMNRSVGLIHYFPGEVRAVMGDGMIYLAERKFSAQETMANQRILGREKILALYKSKNKRREYDAQPSLHKALNYHCILPATHQEKMGEQVFEMVGQVYDYFKLCRNLVVSPSLSQIQLLTVFYVENGKDGAKGYLKNVEATMVSKQGASKPVPAEAPVPRNGSGVPGLERLENTDGNDFKITETDHL